MNCEQRRECPEKIDKNKDCLEFLKYFSLELVLDSDEWLSLTTSFASLIPVDSGMQYYCCCTVMYQCFCFWLSSDHLQRFVLKCQLKATRRFEKLSNLPLDSLDDALPSTEFPFFVISFEYPEVVNSPAKVVCGSS